MPADPTPLFPVLTELVDARDGVAEVVEPRTGRVFVVVEKRAAADLPPGPPELSIDGKTDEEIAAMIDAGRRSGPATAMTRADWAMLHARVDAASTDRSAG